MPESQLSQFDERHSERLAGKTGQGDDWEEAGEEEVPTVVLFVIAGLLVISFTLYLVVGGGHSHFHESVGDRI